MLESERNKSSIRITSIYRALLSTRYMKGTDFLVPFKILVGAHIDQDIISKFTIKNLCLSFYDKFKIEISDSPMRTIISSLCNEKIVKKKEIQMSTRF